MEWISVKDRLPDFDVQVWVNIKGCEKPYLFSRCNLGYDGWLWADHYNEIDGEGYFDDDYDVTHWMPFIKPELPKK